MKTLVILSILVLACSSVIMAATSGTYTTADGHICTINVSGDPTVSSYGQGRFFTLRPTFTDTNEDGPVAGAVITLGALTRPFNGMTATNKEGHFTVDVSAPQPILMNTANIPVYVNDVKVFTWTPKVSTRIPGTNAIWSGTVSGFGNMVGDGGFLVCVNGEYVTDTSGYDKSHPVTQEETLSVEASTDVMFPGPDEIPAASCGAASSGTQVSIMQIDYGHGSGILPSKLHWTRHASPSVAVTGTAILGSGTGVASVIFTDLVGADCSAKLVATRTPRTETDNKNPPPEKKIISGSTGSVSAGFSGSATLAGAVDATKEFRGVALTSKSAANYSQSVGIYTFDEVK